MLIMFIITFIIGAAVAITCAVIYSFNIGYIIGGALLLAGVICTLVAFLRRKKSAKRFNETVADELAEIDEMTGLEFEQYAAELFEELGYENVTVTGSSHDQGADIIMERDGVRFAVQCKVYSTRLGNTPVQEIVAAREFYGCHVGVVVTNSYFTDFAVDLAKANRVLLWDRVHLAALIDKNM